MGIALTARGELDAAAAAFAASADAAGESLTLFASWAAARRALVALAAGSTAGVAAWVEYAPAVGPPLGHDEARLAEARLAVARDDPRASELAAAAHKLALAGAIARTCPSSLVSGNKGYSTCFHSRGHA